MAFGCLIRPEIIRSVAQHNHIQLKGTSLFYYEVYENEFDGKNWLPYKTGGIVSHSSPCAFTKEP